MRPTRLLLCLALTAALTASAALAQTTVAVPDADGNVGWSPSVVLDAAGNPVIAHRDRSEDDLRVVRCHDPGCQEPATVSVPDTEGRTGLNPQIALDPVGNPIVAYSSLPSDSAPDVDDGLWVLRCGDPACAGAGQRTFYDDRTFSAFRVDMVLSSAGNPIIATASADTREVRVLLCDDPGCAGSDPRPTIATDAVGAVAVGVRSDDRPVIAYQTGDGFNTPRMFHIAVCADASCSSANGAALGEEAFGSGTVQALAVGPDDVPAAVAYRRTEDDRQRIVMVRCSDESCSSLVDTTIADLGDEFFLSEADIVTTDDGRPIISYNDATQNLVVVACGNAACTTSSSSRPDANSADDGLFSDLVLADDGGLVIAHHDRDDGDLRVVRCEDTACAPPAPSISAGAVDTSRLRFPPHPGFGPGQRFAGAVAPTHGDLASHVVLATTTSFADSLSGAVLTADGPMLFTDPGVMDPDTRTEIDRVLGGSGTIYVLGGEVAVSSTVTAQLEAAGYTIERLAGASRFETSVAIAEQARAISGDTDEVALARAFGPADNPTAAWADSVTGGGWAAVSGTPVVLTTSDAVHPAVQAFLDTDAPSIVTLLGGTAALSADLEGIEGARRVAGQTRFDTARQIALELWQQPEDGARGYLVLDATAENGWAAGLPAAGLAADLDAPILAVGGTVPPETLAAVGGCGDEVRLTAVGTVVDAVLAELAAADDDPC